MRRPIVISALCALTLVLSACTEETKVDLHEPGKYMGKPDQGMAASTPARDEALNKRLMAVQSDR